jgi:hypothetical protein
MAIRKKKILKTQRLFQRIKWTKIEFTLIISFNPGFFYFI